MFYKVVIHLKNGSHDDSVSQKERAHLHPIKVSICILNSIIKCGICSFQWFSLEPSDMAWEDQKFTLDFPRKAIPTVTKKKVCIAR